MIQFEMRREWRDAVSHVDDKRIDLLMDDLVALAQGAEPITVEVLAPFVPRLHAFFNETEHRLPHDRRGGGVLWLLDSLVGCTSRYQQEPELWLVRILKTLGDLKISALYTAQYLWDGLPLTDLVSEGHPVPWYEYLTGRDNGYIKLKEECAGVRLYSDVNCHYIVANGVVRQRNGFHGPNLFKALAHSTAPRFNFNTYGA